MHTQTPVKILLIRLGHGENFLTLNSLISKVGTEEQFEPSVTGT